MAFQSIGEILTEILDDIKHRRVCEACGEIFIPKMRGDSVLEESFWYTALKSDGGWHGATDQLPIGRYRVDAIFDCKGEAVVVELDGKAYHDREADHYRDKWLVQQVGAVIRIPYAAMTYYPDATFKVLGDWFPRLKKPTPTLVLTADELQREVEEVDESDEYRDPSEFIEQVEKDYDVYSVDGDIAYVGSPKNFINPFGKPQVISIQRGKTNPRIIEQIYAKSRCDKGKISIRARAA